MSHCHSILPYLLQKGQSFGLCIPDCPLLSDADPIFRVFNVDLLADTRSVFQKLVLVIQKDHYTLSASVQRTLTNKDIDATWQQAVLKQRSSQNALPLLKETDDAGIPVQFCSVFRCQRSGRFFHPPCPKCGHLLELCTDEALLEHKELPLYSSSLYRFLFCPQCSENNAHCPIYTYTQDPYLPQWVQTCQNLEHIYSNIVAQKNIDPHFPCHLCPKLNECKGWDENDDPLLTSFVFYPHYMFLHSRVDLRASAFMALLRREDPAQIVKLYRDRGLLADAHSIQTHCTEQNQAFLFEDGERAFLETLYLKLCFLQEAINHIQRDSSLQTGLNTDTETSLATYWIRLGHPVDPLPRFWTFSSYHLGPCPDHNPRPKQSSTLSRIGILWFQSLMGDNSRKEEEIMHTLEACLDPAKNNVSSEAEDSFRKLCKIMPPSVLRKNQERKDLPEDTLQLWDESLRIGWNFLSDPGQISSEEVALPLIQKLQALLASIRSRLFSGTTSHPKNGDRPSDSDHDVHETFHIVQSIFARWEDTYRSQLRQDDLPSISEDETLPLQDFSSPQMQEKTQTENTLDLDETITETVLLSKKATPVSSEDTDASKHTLNSPKSSQGEEDLQETVILGSAGQSPHESTQTSTTDAKDIPETVLLNKDFSTQDDRRDSEKATEDDLLETVVLHTNNVFTSKEENVPEGTIGNGPEEEQDEEDLQKTVVLHPKQGTGQGRN